MDSLNLAKKIPKILCIEDEQFTAELYQQALNTAGFSVTIVGDGVDGLKEAQTDDYDVILLDLMMPNLSGEEILDSLRDLNKTPHLKAKIIVTTNLDENEKIKAKTESKADAYLVKADLTPSQLVEVINKVIQA